MRVLNILICCGLVGCGWGAPVEETPSGVAAPAGDHGPGKWRKVRSVVKAKLTPEQEELIAQLEAIGYADGTQDVKVAKSLTVFEEGQVTPGYNLYNSGHGAEAFLTDVRGEVLHTWTSSFAEAFPDSSLRRTDPGVNHWRRVKLGANGDLYAIFEGRGIVRLNAQGEVVWAQQNKAHHDLQVLPDGGVAVLVREGAVIPELHAARPILRDFIELLDAKGEVTRRVDLLQALLDSEYADVLDTRSKKAGDIFHTNSLVFLDGSAAALHPAFQEGRALVSMRNLDAIGVVDMDTERFVWLHKDSYAQQHDASMLPDGRLMLFDNTGKSAGSRVLIYTLPEMELSWSFAGNRRRPFRSATLGTAQWLPQADGRGHVLVTESEGGRAMELTEDKTVVWELYNPYRAGEEGEFIAALFAVERLSEDLDVSWMPGGAE